jgi:hypothetical protein
MLAILAGKDSLAMTLLLATNALTATVVVAQGIAKLDALRLLLVMMKTKLRKKKRKVLRMSFRIMQPIQAWYTCLTVQLPINSATNNLVMKIIAKSRSKSFFRI